MRVIDYLKLTKNRSFRNLIAILRVAYDKTNGWQANHSDSTFPVRHETFVKSVLDKNAIYRDTIRDAFMMMVLSVVEADDRLHYNAEDIQWFFDLLNQDDETVCDALNTLHQLYRLPDKYITTNEVFAKTGRSDSRIRAMVRDGRIPGAILDGKTWRLPVGILRMLGILEDEL